MPKSPLSSPTKPTSPPLPPLSALFLIRFDKRIGYTIAWQRSSSSSPMLDGIVEYKSLPSGSHHLKEDLIYFTVGKQHAGCSAFASRPASAADRGATFAAVGCLVRRSGGRLGKAWLHASALRSLCARILSSSVSADTPSSSDDDDELEQYWASHREDENSVASPASTRPRALSESLVLRTQQPEAAAHPVHSAMALLRAFGPLVFPLYRAALLRRRVLLVGKPPLREACDWVYVLGVLASVPDAVAVAADLDQGPLRRSRALFNVGVHDIDEIQGIAAAENAARYTDETQEQEQSEEEEAGYLACTSDELLATKPALYDAVVRLGTDAAAWPAIHAADGSPIYATARDLRRYKGLRRGLARVQSGAPRTPSRGGEAQTEDTGEGARLLRRREDEDEGDHDDKELHLCVEAAPWAAIAYDSFVWWASAGERNAELEEEAERDREMLDSASELFSAGASSNGRRRRMSAAAGGANGESSDATQISPAEVAVVGYFHRLTGGIFTTLTDLLDDKAEDEQQQGDAILSISRADMVKMGLDGWSKADRAFVVQLVALYFGIEARVQGPTVECCGVRFL